MRIKFEPDDNLLIGAFRDLTSALVVARLKEAKADCMRFNKHPGDRKYNKKFNAAADVIIEYFGGKD